MPPGKEDLARAFYVGQLEMTELPKPAPLAARGGCWFESGAVKLHLGVEQDFRPARKAHPALLVDDLPGVCARLRAAGLDVRDDNELPDRPRANLDDPFGNRLELVENWPGGR